MNIEKDGIGRLFTSGKHMIAGIAISVCVA